MVERSRILNYAHAIAREFKPEKIILFGSYAYGRPSEDSDVDLLVVMRHRGRAGENAIRIRQWHHPGFPFDLLVRSPKTICKRIAWGDSFLREVTEHGEVLYESHHQGVGAKSRG